MQLHELKSTTKNRKETRVGRGGKRGTYSGRGTKGQKARSGHRIRPAIRDLLIRIPKLRGFANKAIISKPEIVNIKNIESKVKETLITGELLAKYGLIKNPSVKVKVLSNGEVKRALTLQGISVSEKTKQKIEAAGGKVE